MKTITVFRTLITPDGTYLPSYYNHHYNQHVDKVTGETYALDGGNEKYYQTLQNIVQADGFELTNEDHITLLREYVTRGTKHNDKPVRKLIKHISNTHLDKIITESNENLEKLESLPVQTVFYTEYHDELINKQKVYIDNWNREKQFRLDNKIVVEDNDKIILI